MLRLLNITPDESQIKGWKVDIRKLPDRKPSYRVVLDGAESGVHVILNRDDYFDLTTPHGVLHSAPTKLASIKTNSGYRPLVMFSEDEDTNIILLNFQLDVGEVFSDIIFDNILSINYHITEEDNRFRFTLCAVTSDPTKQSSIEIQYGYNGGKNLSIQKIIYPPSVPTPSLQFNMEKDMKRVEEIKSKFVKLPKFDLSTVCINEKG